jgi:hypothetical protein
MSSKAMRSTDKNDMGYMLGMLAFAGVALVLIGILYITDRFAIPDWIYRDMAGSSAMPPVWILVLLTFTFGVPALLSKAGLPYTGMAVMIVGMMVSCWYMIATVNAVDFDGSRNPYVRAQEADAEAYRELAAFSDDAGVATLIRKARSDGLVTQGEAYDIIHSRPYRAARSAAASRETAKARRAVLTAG